MQQASAVDGFGMRSDWHFHPAWLLGKCCKCCKVVPRSAACTAVAWRPRLLHSNVPGAHRKRWCFCQQLRMLLFSALNAHLSGLWSVFDQAPVAAHTSCCQGPSIKSTCICEATPVRWRLNWAAPASLLLGGELRSCALCTACSMCIKLL